MAATFSPSFVIDVTDSIGAATATITLPNGSWNLSSVTTTGSDAASAIAVSNGTSNAISRTVGAATVTFPATDPSVVFTTQLLITNGAGTLNDTVVRLSSAIGQTLTIAVA